MQRLAPRAFAVLFLVVLQSSCVHIPDADRDPPSSQQLTVDEWREDIHFFVGQLTAHHRDPYHLIQKEEFDRSVASFLERVPQLEPYEVVVGLHALAAQIGDGHTFLAVDDIYHRFPLEVFWFGKDLRVVRAARDYRTTLGLKLVAVNAMDIEAVHARLQQLIPQGENRWHILDASARLMLAAEPLAALDVIPDVGPACFTFERDDGQRITIEIAPDNTSEWLDASEQKPLHRSDHDAGFSYTYLPQHEAVYVLFRSYFDLERETAGLWRFLEERAVKKLIIDLRHNGGGNYTEGRKHLVYKLQFLPRLNRTGRLFIIIGRHTFSAAMTNATDFRRETEANSGRRADRRASQRVSGEPLAHAAELESESFGGDAAISVRLRGLGCCPPGSTYRSGLGRLSRRPRRGARLDLARRWTLRAMS